MQVKEKGTEDAEIQKNTEAQVVMTVTLNGENKGVWLYLCHDTLAKMNRTELFEFAECVELAMGEASRIHNE